VGRLIALSGIESHRDRFFRGFVELRSGGVDADSRVKGDEVGIVSVVVVLRDAGEGPFSESSIIVDAIFRDFGEECF